MESIEKSILTAIYLGQLKNTSPISIIKENNKLDEDYINSKIEVLIKNGLVNDNRVTLTELGRNSLRVVLAGGVFDIIHPGHIYTLNAARELGDVLVVVAATDKTAIRMKKRKPLHTQDQRQELIESLKMVDICMIGHEEDMFITVDKIRPQVIALGYDQVHQEKFIKDGCQRIKLDAKIARLQSPIPDSSSSKIEKEYGESIYGI